MVSRARAWNDHFWG